MKILFVTVLMASIALLGCNDELEYVSQISKFRVMGVQAEPPEIRPGEGTTLKVLLADPNGEGREINVMWVAFGGTLSPTGDMGEDGELEPIGFQLQRSIQDGGDTFEIAQVSEDILDSLPENETDLRVTVFGLACAGGTLPQDPEVVFESFGKLFSGEFDDQDDICEGGDADGLVFTKSFTVSSSDNPNTNPLIHSLSFDGATISENDLGSYECTGSDGCRDPVDLVAYLTADSFQTYEKRSFGEIEEREEEVYISWFVTGGSIDRDHSGVADLPEDAEKWGPFEAGWEPPRLGGAYSLWVVAHDLRGGASWKQYQIEAALGI